MIFAISTNALAQISNEEFLKRIEGLDIKPNGTPLKVGIAFADFSVEWSITASSYPKWLLEKAGTEVVLVNTDYDLEFQQNTLDDFVSMGVDIIILQPVDDFAIANKVREIQTKGGILYG